MTNVKKPTTVSELIKLVVESGNDDELNKFVEQLKNTYIDGLFGEQESLYEIYKNHFPKNL